MKYNPLILPCPACLGTGFLRLGIRTYTCLTCDGRGITTT